MRGAGRALSLACGGALLLLVLTVGLLLPRLVARADLPGRLAEALREGTGREPRLGAVSLAWLPPTLRIDGVALAPAPGTPPEAAAGWADEWAADTVTVRLAPSALVRGRVVAHEVGLEGLRLRVVAHEAAAPDAETGAPAPDTAAAPGAGVAAAPGSAVPADLAGLLAAPRAFGAERVQLAGGRVELVDARVSPPVTARWSDVTGTLSRSADGLAFALAGRLESGGGTGSAASAGGVQDSSPASVLQEPAK